MHTARAYAGKYLGVGPDDRKADRANAPKLRDLFTNPAKPDELYPLWPPLLFPQRDTLSTRPLQCEALVKVGLSIY